MITDDAREKVTVTADLRAQSAITGVAAG